MMRYLLALLALCLLACSPKIYPEHQADSVRVEYRERIIHDTVRYEVPVEVERIVTRDTTSTLTNSLATSTASVSGGLLRHTLETRKTTINVPAHVAVRDTIIIQKAAETIVREVPAQLSGWQRFCIALGKCAMVAAAMLALIGIFKLIRYVKK